MKWTALSRLLLLLMLVFETACSVTDKLVEARTDLDLPIEEAGPEAVESAAGNVVVIPDSAEPVAEAVVIALDGDAGSPVPENVQATEGVLSSSSPDIAMFESGEASEPDYAVVTAFFGTDRSYIAGAKPAQRFGPERSKLRYGQVEVSIPRDHRMGELEAPGWFANVISGENPKDHVVLLDAKLLGKEAMFERVRAAASDSENAAFVFVHGYKTSFEKAARRTAQMAYDIGFEGAPIFYSWPSQNSAIKYTVDEQNAEWTKNNLKTFLKEVADNLDGKKIFLVAHSMGNRPVTRALIDLKNEVPAYRDKSPFEEIILAAPDIDAAVFKEDIAPQLGWASDPVTLYVSSKDKALLASHKVHDFPRIGDGRSGIEAIKGFEVIDASAVESSFLSHSYFADASSVLSDIFYLIRDGKRASDRFGLVSASPGLWRIKQR